MLRHKGKEAVLTARESELLQFLFDDPHRFYTASQIMGHAWSDSAVERTRDDNADDEYCLYQTHKPVPVTKQLVGKKG